MPRLALEKSERQARQAIAAAERKARMAKQAAKTGEDPVAAALARVKARQLAETADGTAAADDMTVLRAARKEEARRNRALKAAQENAEQAAAPATQGKNPAVVAALARAKARRAQQEMHSAAQPQAPAAHDGVPKNAAPIDAKKAAIKAAVERAKARQAAEHAAAMAKSAASTEPLPITEVQPTIAPDNTATGNTATADSTAVPVDAKKAAIQAVVARAKARKAAQAAESAIEPDPVAESAAAHQHVSASDAPASNTVTTAETPQPDAAAVKQAAIKAAVARAKARQAAKTADADADKSAAPTSDPLTEDES